MVETVHSRTANIIWIFTLSQSLGQGTSTIEFGAGHFLVLGSALFTVGCLLASLPLSTRRRQRHPAPRCANQKSLVLPNTRCGGGGCEAKSPPPKNY